MTGVHIVTDSSCDLSEAETTTNGIGVVPLNIRFGNDEYIDREELSVNDFYAKMATTGLLPETSAPSPGRFEQAFRGAAAVGASAVVCINLSGELSATVQSARNAATAVGERLSEIRATGGHELLFEFEFIDEELRSFARGERIPTCEIGHVWIGTE
jgi:DegV family protein with EDD domain